MLKTIQEASTDFEENECPGCGLTRDQWSAHAGKGFSAKGLTYCCQECADGAGCRCSAHSRIVGKLSLHPGVQVLDHGRLHSERRRRQLERSNLPERRSSAPTRS